MIPLSWSGRSAGIGVLRTRCIGCWTSPSAKMTAECATGRLRATSLFFARSLSTWSPETGAPKPASVAGARRLPGTTPTCSRSSHAKLVREPCPLPAPAIAPGPEGAQGTGRSLVVDPFLVRAADDPVHHRDRAHAKPVHVGQDLLGNPDVLAHVALLGEPSLQFDRLLVLGQNDADRQLARPAVIRAVEGDCSHRVAPKAFLGLLGQPLACSLPDHALPVQLSGPATQSHKLALRQRPQGPSLRLSVSCVAPDG